MFIFYTVQKIFHNTHIIYGNTGHLTYTVSYYVYRVYIVCIIFLILYFVCTELGVAIHFCCTCTK